jgi:hypothetical protein
MKIDKNKLLQIIKEVLNEQDIGNQTILPPGIQRAKDPGFKRIQPPGMQQPQDQKAAAQQNVDNHLNSVKSLSAEISKERGTPAINKIIKNMRDQQSSVFLNQFLGLPTELVYKVNVNNMLNNPYSTIANILNGILQQAQQAAKKKLAE